MLKKTKLIITGVCSSAVIAGLFSAIGIGYYFSKRHDVVKQKVDLKNEKQVKLSNQLNKYELLAQVTNYADILNNKYCFNINDINKNLYPYLNKEIIRICGLNTNKDYLNLVIYYSLNFLMIVLESYLYERLIQRH